MVLTEERVKELLLRAKQRAGGSEADASAVPAAGVGKFTVIGLLILALIVTGAANGGTLPVWCVVETLMLVLHTGRLR